MAELEVGDQGGGTTIGGLDVPSEASVVAVVRGRDARLARPDAELEPGDVVIAVGESDDALDRLRATLARR